MDATTRKKVWRVLSFALKLLVTALILYGLFRRMDFGKVWQNLLNQPVWLILAILGPVSYTHLTLPTIYSV